MWKYEEAHNFGIFLWPEYFMSCVEQQQATAIVIMFKNSDFFLLAKLLYKR